MFRHYVFIDRSYYNETDRWFANRTLYHKHVNDEIKNLRQVTKKMRKDRIALIQATISFKYFIDNMSIEKGFKEAPDTNRELLDNISYFQTQMARLFQKQTDSDNLLVWFTEDYIDTLKRAETALALRRGLMVDLEKNQERTEFADNVNQQNK